MAAPAPTPGLRRSASSIANALLAPASRLKNELTGESDKREEASEASPPKEPVPPPLPKEAVVELPPLAQLEKDLAMSRAENKLLRLQLNDLTRKLSNSQSQCLSVQQKYTDLQAAYTKLNAGTPAVDDKVKPAHSHAMKKAKDDATRGRASTAGATESKVLARQDSLSPTFEPPSAVTLVLPACAFVVRSPTLLTFCCLLSPGTSRTQRKAAANLTYWWLEHRCTPATVAC
jgi:hypothetical protein